MSTRLDGKAGSRPGRLRSVPDESGQLALEFVREPGNREFDVQLEGGVDEVASVCTLVSQIGCEIAFEPSGAAFFGGGEFLPQSGDGVLVALDRKRRLVAERAPGDFCLAGVEIQCVDQVLAGCLDGCCVLVGQFSREERIDASTAFDQREQVRALDGHVLLADRLA